MKPFVRLKKSLGFKYYWVSQNLRLLRAATGNTHYPLIVKFNPRRENLHILELTPETNMLFNGDSLFVSYKMESNIKSLITLLYL